jgi:hypothetical protein
VACTRWWQSRRVLWSGTAETMQSQWLLLSRRKPRMSADAYVVASTPAARAILAHTTEYSFIGWPQCGQRGRLSRSASIVSGFSPMVCPDLGETSMDQCMKPRRVAVPKALQRPTLSQRAAKVRFAVKLRLRIEGGGCARCGASRRPRTKPRLMSGSNHQQWRSSYDLLAFPHPRSLTGRTTASSRTARDRPHVRGPQHADRVALVLVDHPNALIRRFGVGA